MAHQTRRIALAGVMTLVVLTPAAASAKSSCVLPEEEVGAYQRYASVKTYLVEKTYDMSAADKASLTEAEAQKLVCGGPCQPGKTFEFGDGANGDLLIAGKAGELHALEDAFGSGMCLSTSTSAARVAPDLYRVHIQQLARSCPDDMDDPSYVDDDRWYLLDIVSGAYLLKLASAKTTATVSGDTLAVNACGKKSFSLEKLRLKAGHVVFGKTFDKLVAQGRSLTRNHADLAVEAFQRALKLKPKSAGTHAELGHALLKARRYKEAKKTLKAALSMSPKPRFQGTVWFNLGLVAEGQKDKKAARAAFEKAHALRPSKATARKLGLKR